MGDMVIINNKIDHSLLSRDFNWQRKTILFQIYSSCMKWVFYGGTWYVVMCLDSVYTYTHSRYLFYDLEREAVKKEWKPLIYSIFLCFEYFCSSTELLLDLQLSCITALPYIYSPPRVGHYCDRARCIRHVLPCTMRRVWDKPGASDAFCN